MQEECIEYGARRIKVKKAEPERKLSRMPVS